MDLLLYTPVDIIPTTAIQPQGSEVVLAASDKTGRPFVDVVDVVRATGGDSIEFGLLSQTDGLSATNRIVLPGIKPGTAVNVVCRRSITGTEDTAGPVAVRRGMAPSVGLVDGLEKDLQTALRFMLRTPGTSFMDPDSGGGLLSLLRRDALSVQSASAAAQVACNRFNQWLAARDRNSRARFSLERVRVLDVRMVAPDVARSRYGSAGLLATQDRVVVVALQWKRRSTGRADDITTISTV
jgi:hypothetical protein